MVVGKTSVVHAARLCLSEGTDDVVADWDGNARREGAGAVCENAPRHALHRVGVSSHTTKGRIRGLHRVILMSQMAV